MRAHVENRWYEGAWEITLVEHGRGPNGWAYSYEDGNLIPNEVKPGGTVPATLVLPYEAVEAIVAALPGKVTASDATLDALVDTRGTRDRLLALVERLTDVTA